MDSFARASNSRTLVRVVWYRYWYLGGLATLKHETCGDE
jgi:hypothetical protein